MSQPEPVFLTAGDTAHLASIHTKHLVLEPGDMQGLRNSLSPVPAGATWSLLAPGRLKVTHAAPGSGQPALSLQQSLEAATACSPRLGPWSAADAAPERPAHLPGLPPAPPRPWVLLQPRPHPSGVLQEPFLGRQVAWAGSARRGRGTLGDPTVAPPFQEIAPKALRSPAVSRSGEGGSFSCR